MRALFDQAAGLDRDHAWGAARGASNLFQDEGEPEHERGRAPLTDDPHLLCVRTPTPKYEHGPVRLHFRDKRITHLQVFSPTFSLRARRDDEPTDLH